MSQSARRGVSFLLTLAGILVFLTIIFYFDNKYSTDMPLPQDGVLSLCEADFTGSSPVFLIDDWQICEGVRRPDEMQDTTRTWVGEFSNYRRYNKDSNKPLGSATYQLRLRYSGRETLARFYSPELCESYTLWWDDQVLAEGQSSAQAAVLLTEGVHTLTVSITADSGYYAGMYFPGAIGSDAAIMRMVGMQTAVYGAVFLIPLVLALFCLLLWAQTGDRLRRCFGLFCLSFALSLCHHFLQLWPNPLSPYRFLISDLALYAMFYFAVELTLLAAKKETPWFRRPLLLVSCILPAIEVLLYFSVPAWSGAAFLHGMLQNGYRIFLFACLVFGGIGIWKQDNAVCRRILCANGALGLSLLLNLAASNFFEPKYTLWQYEWCGFAAVLLFASMMAAQNRVLLLDNQAYREHLEELVDKRTRQLSCVLDERRAFFSDMAHDLKAPLSSLGAFISLIRMHDVELDSEMQFYLEQVEQQRLEMARRVGSLNELNAVDRLRGTPEHISVEELLAELHHRHNPDAVASGIHLIIKPVDRPITLFAQKDKLLVIFENLFYNALRFTPKDGVITISAEMDGQSVKISVSDTGCGIPQDELPHVFERFYSGKMGKQTGGSGLGLYISKMILEELGGQIQVQSEENSGSCFTLLLPQIK